MSASARRLVAAGLLLAAVAGFSANSPRALAERGQNVGAPTTAAMAARQPPASTVTVLGAGTTGLAVTSRSPSLRFRVELQAGSTGARDVRIFVGDLRAESGRPHDVEVASVQPRNLAPNGVGRAVVTASVPEPGTYTSSILVSHDGKREPAVPLVVTRTRTAPTVDLNGTGTAELVWGPRATAAVTFTLTETAGDEVRLAIPTLVDLGRAASDVNPQPSETRVIVQTRDQGGKDWKPVAADGVVLPASGAKEVRFELPGIESPGSYTATAKVREAGGTSVDKAVKIFVRYPLWILWLAVGIGIALSYLIQVVLQRSRTRIVLRRRLGEIVVDLGEALGDPSLEDDPKVNELVKVLLGAKEGLERRIRQRADTPGNTMAEVDRLERRAVLAPTWVRLHRLLMGLKPPALVAEERGTLDALGATLQNDGATEEEIKKASDDLRALDAAVAAKLFKELHNRVEELSRQLNDHEAFLTKPQRDHVSDARATVDRARQYLNAGDYAMASGELTIGQDRFISLLTRDLEAFLEQLPPWVSPKLQPLIQAAVTPKLQGSAPPLDRYRDAMRELFTQLTSVARTRAEGLRDQATKDDVITVLDAIPPRLEQNEFREARELLAKAVERAGGFANTSYRSSGEVRLKRASVPTGVDIAEPLQVPPTRQLRELRVSGRAALQALAAREKLLSRLSLLFATVVALVLATLALYNRAWGSPQDIATAVVWGLGIQAGAGFTFSGVQQLQSQLEGTTPSRTTG